MVNCGTSVAYDDSHDGHWAVITVDPATCFAETHCQQRAFHVELCGGLESWERDFEPIVRLDALHPPLQVLEIQLGFECLETIHCVREQDNHRETAVTIGQLKNLQIIDFTVARACP